MQIVGVFFYEYTCCYINLSEMHQIQMIIFTRLLLLKLSSITMHASCSNNAYHNIAQSIYTFPTDQFEYTLCMIMAGWRMRNRHVSLSFIYNFIETLKVGGGDSFGPLPIHFLFSFFTYYKYEP